MPVFTLNKVMLLGNVGKDPDVRYVDTNMVVAKFVLATSEPGYTLPNGTEVPEHTEWHTILCWNQLAKRVEQYIRKGCRVYIEGKIRTRSYEDKKGITRYFTEINAEKIDIVSFPSSIRPIEGKDAPSVPNTNQ
ncbi:MAG: single-stranded DNA-binding protein [Bacteroidaceae bacterium]|nr:single-stranded DNA-binding protein [Bacteroidaceae bacterium]